MNNKRGETGISEFRQAESESFDAPVPDQDQQTLGPQRGVQDPYAKMRGDVPGDAPSPIEFYERPDGSTAVGLFTQRGDKPEEFTGISAGEALDEQFATPDTDITTDLVKKGGFLSEEEEATLKDRAGEISEFYSIGEEADKFVTGLTGSEKAGAFARGIGKLPGDTVAGIDQAALAGEYGAEVVENFGPVASEEGIEATADAIGETFGAAGKGIGQEAINKPYEFSGGVVGSVLAGTAAFKGIEKAGDAARAARLSTKADVDFKDITTDAGASGKLPGFDTDPNAPAEDAVKEISDRASDNPDVVTEGTGGSTLYHGTQSKFDKDFDVGEGGSELPGLFTSPEASPIKLQGLGTRGINMPSIKPRLPDPSGKSDRFLGLPGDKVDAMSGDSVGAGHAVRKGDELVETGMRRGDAKKLADELDDGSVVPDPTTKGYEFLTKDATPGTAYVRPTGGRTTELEAIFPPESGFTKTGTLGVRVGRRQLPGTNIDIPLTGRTVPLDLFERKGGAPDTDQPDAGAGLETMRPGDAATFESIADDLDRLRTPEGSVAVGGGVTGGTIGIATATGTSSSGTIDEQLADESFDEFTSPTDLDETPPPGSDTGLLDDSSIFDDTTPTGPSSPTGTGGSGSPGGGSPTGGSPGPTTNTGPTTPGTPTRPPGDSGTPTVPGSTEPPTTGRPPSSPPGGSPFGSSLLPSPRNPPDPLTPSEIPEPSSEDNGKKKKKRDGFLAVSKVFTNPAITPEEIASGDVSSLKELDAEGGSTLGASSDDLNNLDS